MKALNRQTLPIAVVMAAWFATPLAPAGESLTIDFEQADALAKYERLQCPQGEAAVVPGGPGAAGHCLRIQNPTPATSCGLRLKGPAALVRNLVLSFDYRTEIEPGFEGTYLGMIFYVDGKQWFFHSDAFAGQWRHADVHLGRLRPWGGHTVRPGLVFSGIQLYGRVKDKTPAKGQTKARMTVYFDNIRLHVAPRQSVLTDRTRESTSNPPMFHWPRPDRQAEQRLQYSTDPAFPDGKTAVGRIANPSNKAHGNTVTLDTKWNFLTPEGPLEPGTWYWRVWSGDDLSEGWSDIERIVVPPEAHRFTTAPVPLEELARRPHPRLLALARLSEPDLTDARKAQLVRNARKLYEQGVPEHPGPHVPGDPRWPTWIDWYGSPHFKAYSMTTLAHNTLLVDGAGQAACKPGADGRIVTYFDSPGYGYTVGDASDPEIYGGRLRRFDRRVLFIKPGFVVVHDLAASSGKPARFDWMLHAVVPVEIDQATGAFTVPCKRAALRGRFLAPAGVGLKVTTGFPVEPVDGYSTRPVPPEKYVPEWHLYATPPKPAEQTEFLAAVQIRRLGEQAESEAAIEPVEAVGAHGVRFRCGDRVHLVLTRKAGTEGEIHAAGLRTDGQAAAIELGPDGKIVRAMAAGARVLRYNQRKLLEVNEPQEWATPQR